MNKNTKTKIISGVVGGAIALATISGAVALNNVFNDTKVDYVVKEEIKFSKADFILSRENYVLNYDDLFIEASNGLSEGSESYNSFININKNTVAILVSDSTTFTDDLKFTDSVSEGKEWIYIISRDKLVDVSFENKTHTYEIMDEGCFEVSNYMPGQFYNIDEYLPEECFANLVDPEEYEEMTDKELQSFNEEFTLYCITLQEFTAYLKDGVDEDKYTEVKDYNKLQSMTLTFLKD